MNSSNTNIQKSDGISLHDSAIIAGIGLVLMAILAPVANFSILRGIVIPDDAAKTVSNLIESEGSFRLAILLFSIVALLDIVVAWSLYIFLKPINKSISLLAAWLRIVYAAMLGLMLIYLINVLQLVSGADYLTLFETGQIEGMVMLSLTNFTHGWEFSLIFFGFHLLLLGFLVLKAGYMRNILGILLIISSLGYIIDGFGRMVSPGYNISISLFTFIGEVILIFWLLIEGRKVKA